MEFLHQLLGEHAWEVWGAGMIWAFIGIMGVKVYFLKPKIKFSFKFWINDNFLDVIKGLVAALLILRLGDYVIHLLKDKTGFEIPDTEDFVILMIVLSGALQIYLHKKRKALSAKVKEQMHVHNEHCNHNHGNNKNFGTIPPKDPDDDA